jgi:hypothetical protein
MSFEKCKICNKLIYPFDPKIIINESSIHKQCIKCRKCVIPYQSHIIIDGDFYHKPCPKEVNLNKNHDVNLTIMRDNISINTSYSHPYEDFNDYNNDSDYKQKFYNKFSDPWKVRNDVENNDHIVSEFGEVFSPEQIKYYKKLGYNINPDTNIH